MKTESEQPDDASDSAGKPGAPSAFESRSEKSLPLSFEDAFNGVNALFRSQPHVRLYFVLALLALLVAALLKFNTIQLLFLASAILTLFVAEALNTGIEAAVDLACPTRHNLAKIAKDCGAAGVLFAVAYALVISAALYFNVMAIHRMLSLWHRALSEAPTRYPLVALLALVAWVLFAILVMGNHRQLGPWPVAAHSGVAFFTATALALISGQSLVALQAYFIAFLTAQTRLSGERPPRQAAAVGAACGVVLCGLVFWLWPL